MITRIIRPIQGRIEVRGLPKNRDPAVPNRQWFKDSLQKHIRPNWVSYSSGYGHWEIARSHLQPVVEAIVRREGEVLWSCTIELTKNVIRVTKMLGASSAYVHVWAESMVVVRVGGGFR